MLALGGTQRTPSVHTINFRRHDCWPKQHLSAVLQHATAAARPGVQVVAMRLPVELLMGHLAAILEGILLWASDSKNKFKLKVPLGVHSPEGSFLFMRHPQCSVSSAS